ncbi:MAG: SDR family NAD(P)-dependent oxidoreductase, partial [Deltaproteobacteria bacterium]|nr:SDR family NAD(P)-dependent oxidoreductase [Deltaproteobacteria bacterium]
VKAAPVASAPAATAASVDVKTAFLEVVAEKTGYPSDALELDMNLEADLGIDSIKRVEILGAMKDKVPGLPELDAVAAASLTTLGMVIDAYGSVAPAPQSAAPVASAAPATGNVDVKTAFLEVVAEKTGYPADALDLEMNLEADLGIDSIKRVEILGAMKDKVPGLPELDAVAAASLTTLGMVIDAYCVSAPAAPAPAAAAPAAGVDIKTAFLEVVAEKTGYPADALDLEMNLEADLGIDSIKRVEILGAMKDKVPGLPELDAVAAASLTTLGMVIEAYGVSSPAATAPAAQVSNGATIDVTSAFLEVVAEKTGYPTDALELEMNLEADLGIDSIKRVEILGAVKERVPEMADLDAMRLAQLGTLGEICKALESTTTGGGLGKPEGVAPKGVTPAASFDVESCLQRRAVTLASFPASAADYSAMQGGTLALLADSRGIAEKVQKLLKGHDVKAEILPASLDSVKAESYLGLVSFAGLDDVKALPDARAIVERTFLAVQKFAGVLNGTHGNGVLVSVQDIGGRLGFDANAPERAPLGSLAAFMKTASLEWTSAKVKAVDVVGGDIDSLATFIADELGAGFAQVEVCLSEKGREGPTVRAAPLDEPKVILEPGDLVVATGGARGVTASSLEMLARKAQPTLLLLGRSDISQVEPAEVAGIANDEAALKGALIKGARARGEKVKPAEVNKLVWSILGAREIKANIGEMEAAGSRVRYVSVDVRNKNSLESALQDARRDFGPVKGLVHGAGVLADKKIEDKTMEQFARVWETKVDGLYALLNATAEDPLKMLCMYSSVAGRFGNVGQVDYSMANEALNKIAQAEQKRRGDECVVKSINWGPWDGGMVTPALRRHFEAQGVALLPLAYGATVFVEELSLDAPSVEIVFGGPLTGDEEGSIESITPRKVNESAFAYLADHSVQGIPVLPVVLALEFISSAAKQFREDLDVIGISDLQVLKGVRLEGFKNGGDVLEIVLGNERVVGSNVLVDAKVQRKGQMLPHYKAVVELGVKRDDVKSATHNEKLPKWKMSKKAIYDKHLFHGPEFQLINRIEGASDEVLRAQVSGLPTVKWSEDNWHVDVAALDAGLQLVLLLAEKSIGGSFLPMGLDRYASSTSVFENKNLICNVKLTKKTSTVATCNVEFVDDNGSVVFTMEGVKAVQLPGGASYTNKANAGA